MRSFTPRFQQLSLAVEIKSVAQGAVSGRARGAWPGEPAPLPSVPRCPLAADALSAGAALRRAVGCRDTRAFRNVLTPGSTRGREGPMHVCGGGARSGRAVTCAEVCLLRPETRHVFLARGQRRSAVGAARPSGRPGGCLALSPSLGRLVTLLHHARRPHSPRARLSS